MTCGVDSIAIDPADKRTVILTMNAARPDMLKANGSVSGGNVYTSRDGGITFTAGRLSLTMEPNGPWRTEGERLKVDPEQQPRDLLRQRQGRPLAQPERRNGLDRRARSRCARAQADHVLGVHFAAHAGTVERDGLKCSRMIFAVMPRKSVLMSSDGGATWKSISAGTKLEGVCMFSTVDASGVLHVVAGGSRELWTWVNGGWRQRTVVLDWERTPHAVAFDPRKPNRIFAISDGGGLSRSLDGGKTWTPLGPEMVFAGRLGWLPQKAGWRSNAGIAVDRDGVCWIPQGNEGMLHCKTTDREDPQNPPRWTIDSVGIEEFVTHDVILPPGGDAIFAVEDATGLITSDPTRFVARADPASGSAPLQRHRTRLLPQRSRLSRDRDGRHSSHGIGQELLRVLRGWRQDVVAVRRRAR